MAYRFGSAGKWAAGHFSAWAAWSPHGLSSLFYFFSKMFLFD
jgi:hypothetical protein